MSIDPWSAGDGLARAAAVFLARAASATPEPIDTFLERHGDLREWLEPMLADEPIAVVAAAAVPVQATLGSYQLRREIGRGGMGVVYEAVRAGESAPVALKVLPGFLALQAGRSARFSREVAIARELDHPGIVRVVDAGVAGESQFFAMEFVVGAPLDRVLEQLADRSPASLTDDDLARAVAASLHVPHGCHAPPPIGFHGSYIACVVRLATQLAEALAYAHGAGIIHRDVKPSNVLLGPDGRVVLTDFGLARSVETAELTKTGDFAGTPHYVSPEQAMAKRVGIDHRTDLFSFGSTFYELLTLQRAFAGDSTPAVLARILSKEPPPLARFHPGVPEDLGNVVAKLLEKDPDRRYQSAGEVAADLRAFLDYRPVLARRPSTLTRLRRWTVREPVRASLAFTLAVTIPALTIAVVYFLSTAAAVAAGTDQLQAAEVTALVDRGFHEFMQENALGAVGHFAAARAIEPARPEAAIGLLLASLNAAGPEATLQRLEQELPASIPASILDRFRYALLHRLGRPEAAAALARWSEPSTEFDWFLRAVIERDQGTFTGAKVLEDIERAVLASSRPRLWLYAQWAASADAAGDGRSCRNCASTLLATWPDSPIARYFACLSLRRVEPDQALQLARTGQLANAGDGLAHWAEGMVLAARGDAVGAVPALERAVARMPGSPRAIYSLGKARFERGDQEGALQAMTRARELAPRFVEAWLGIGMTLRRLGRSDEALVALQQAVALHGSHADARFQLGQLLVQRQQLDAGIEELREATRLNRGDPNKWHHLASALFAKGDDEGGLDALRRAITAMPSYERGHQVLAMYLQQLDAPGELRAALMAWVQALPGSVDGWLRLGQHCVDPGLAAEWRDAAVAVWAAKRVLALTQQRHASGWLLLGEARQRLGEMDAARQAFAQSLAAELPLSDAERRRAELALRELGPGSPPGSEPGSPKR